MFCVWQGVLFAGPEEMQMGEFVAEICGRIVAMLFCWAILLPLATPFILLIACWQRGKLLIACWQRGKYWENVRSSYGRVLEFCDWTWFI